MKKFLSALIISIISFTILSINGCEKTSISKGKYFVDSEYIIAKASLTSTAKNSKGEVEYYGIDISYDSDIKLNYLKYKCELYSNNKVIETFEDEVPTNGLYSKYIPLKTTKDYEHAKVVCTGWSDENPENFTRLNAKNSVEMQKCDHKNFISAKVETISTNNKKDYMLINYSSTTAFNNFRFFYDNYNDYVYHVSLLIQDIKICVDCGYYEI